MTILGIVAALFFTLIAWELIQILTASAKKNPRIVLINPLSKQTPCIPNIIWSYWDTPEPPDFILLCKDNWACFLPNYEIRMLHKDNIQDWVPNDEMIGIFNQLPVYRQADWLRLQLLRRYGGVWVDASIILTENFDWLTKLQQENDCEYAGFYIDGFTLRKDQPIIENWFMAAIPNSEFIARLIEEFDHAITIGEQNYIDKLKKSDNFKEIVQNLDARSQLYLVMHVAASSVLFRNAKHASLALVCAEDTAFAYHKALRWRKKHLFAKLALMPCPRILPRLIKLRGPERNFIANQVGKQRFTRDSLLNRFLLKRK